jgi:para-aminobenzoate synthetase component 1
LRSTAIFSIDFLPEFKAKAFAWAAHYEVVCYFDHNDYAGYLPHDYEGLLGVGMANSLLCEKEKGAFESLKAFYDEQKDWLFGYFGYDLKNDVERLFSQNFDGVGFPPMHFFQPEIVLEIFSGQVAIHSLTLAPHTVLESILKMPGELPFSQQQQEKTLILQARFTKQEYLQTVQSLRQHILRGDIFEVNFCQEFFAENLPMNPPLVFQRLNRIAKAPFATYYRLHDRHLLCGSPERFLKKKGSVVLSQPIKGTIRRGASPAEDNCLKNKLLSSQKDRSENVMIVDLVRNDLARSCLAGSVTVEELCGVYRFEQVYQLISSISGRVQAGVHWVDVIRNAFPMGSMTGAPKVRSLELIEQYERTRRGLYSGAAGYVTPAGDFDFNVVIRSILYNADSRYLSVPVGGAIVFESEPEEEYAECLVKAGSMFACLGIP